VEVRTIRAQFCASTTPIVRQFVPVFFGFMTVAATETSEGWQRVFPGPKPIDDCMSLPGSVVSEECR